MKIEVSQLQTIKNYARRFNVTASYIYKMIKANKMQATIIDGVQFVDTMMFPKLPTMK